MNPGIAHRRRMAAAIRASTFLACTLLACAAGSGRAAADARVDGTNDLSPPCRLAGISLDRVPVLLTGDATPELLFARQEIERGLNGPRASVPAPAGIGVPGWKSVGRAGAMSLAVPGTGQLYAGSKRGYLFLGVEAVALLSYATFQAKSGEKRDEYHAFVGDPNDPTSRFSFERLGSAVSSAELARLQRIYENDPSEFYDAVTLQGQYTSGWQDPDERYGAQTISKDAERQSDRSRASLYTLIANHLVSAADALNLSRLTNISLRESTTLKLKLRPGGHQASYAFTVTQKF